MTLKYQIQEDIDTKRLISPNYNYVFNKEFNTIVRWGKTKDDNPLWSPFGPEYVTIDTTDMTMELFTVVAETANQMCTVAIYNLLNPTEDMQKFIIGKGLSLVTNHKQDKQEEGFFTIYVDRKGTMLPTSSCTSGINVMEVKNFYKEVWVSKIFQEYRWKKMQEMNQ